MMGNADVKRLQQLIGMDEQYQTGNFRDLTKAALQHWLEERGIYGPQQEINRAEVGQVNSSHTAMDILRRNDRAPLTIENGYAVATNAHFPVEAGGAIGRTDIVKSTGRHECVALLQAYGAPFATQWEVGEKLFPGINLPQNTMIASFERNEHTGQWSYRGHAALFDAESGGYAGEGLHVIQQFENGFPYENQRVVHRGIIPERPDGESRKLGDDASQYYVVKIR
jgi:hypothetical protein